MLISELGYFIDRLSSADEIPAFVDESAAIVAVSNLSHESARKISEMCDELAWNFSLYDGANQLYANADVDADMGPFRVVISKPQVSPDTLEILTIDGLSKFLKTELSHVKWYVAGLSERIVTRSNVLCPWFDTYLFEPMLPTKNPRSLVREYTSVRTVPANIGRWLLVDPEIRFTKSSAFSTWLNASVRAISCSLTNEIDAESGALKFNGTQKFSVACPDVSEDLSTSFEGESFESLQVSAAWVFDNDREAESRHILLATEIARASNYGTEFSHCFGIQISACLSSAKITYQMMLSDLSKDTLKALGDLRKVITEETAKVTDATRQLIGGVSAALAVGFGLIATRISTSTSPWLIAAVMILVAVYVAVIIYSGIQFILIQRQLRADWQSKLYRFLPDADYQKMVSVPAGKSERTFMVSATMSGIAAILLTGVVLFLSFNGKTTGTQNNSSSANNKVSTAASTSTSTSTSSLQVMSQRSSIQVSSSTSVSHQPKPTQIEPVKKP